MCLDQDDHRTIIVMLVAIVSGLHPYDKPSENGLKAPNMETRKK